MKKIKETIRAYLKNLRLEINRINSKKRANRLLIKNPTIISNNCYAGIVYEYLGLQFCSPTIGLYFYADEYIKFCANFNYYISQDLIFIDAKESKYYDELLRRNETDKVIGKLDDVEIVFLHYKSKEEAFKKWNKRVKRINKDCLIFKFCDQNLCTEKNIRDFNELPLDNKFCFTSKEYPELDSIIWIKKDKNKKEVERDYYVGHKYFDIISFINNTIRPRRVLQIGATYNMGGIENFLINYYRRIDKNNLQFDFINIYPQKLCFQDEIQSLGGNIYNVPNYYKHPIKYILEVIDIINKEHYDIVHCHMNSAAMIYPLIAAKFSNAKIIISHSHNASSDKGIIKKILHNINRHFIPFLANRYFACSNLAGSWFYSKKNMKNTNYQIIYNAVDPIKFKYDLEKRNKIRKELRINDNNIVIGHIGRFNKQKNHMFLIDLFSEIHKINDSVKLLLIGDGPLYQKVKDRVHQLNLDDSVLFLGICKNTNELYNAMDLFLLPSLYEGLPLVGVEAQLNGLSTIFSDSITDEVKINENTLFLKLNIETWKKAINNILNSDIKRNKCLNNDFDIINNSKKLQKFYNEMERAIDERDY